jgi:YEATS domain-containing protein 4
VGSKPEYRNHFLQLETYGSEEQQKKQVEDGMVRSEFLEYVEFNEPTEAAWEALTDAEGQWPRIPPSKGKGKNKAVHLYAGGTTGGIMGEGSVDLADRTTEENPFSKQLEQQILAVLRKAEKDVEAELEETKKERARIAGELVEVRTGLGLS